jgi:tetratricopeptide (TPR) repeat protein
MVPDEGEQAEAQQAPPVETEPGATPEETLERADALLEARYLVEAERLFRHALIENPDLTHAHLGLAEAIRMQGPNRRYDALDEYKKYARTQEGQLDWKCHYGMGIIYFELGYYRLAQPKLFTAYQLAPPDDKLGILLDLANTHRGLNEMKEALQCGQKAVEIDPENPVVHQLMAAILSDAGSSEGYQLAVRHAQTALELIRRQWDEDPGNLRLLSQLDLLYNQVAGIYQKQMARGLYRSPGDEHRAGALRCLVSACGDPDQGRDGRRGPRGAGQGHRASAHRHRRGRTPHAGPSERAGVCPGEAGRQAAIGRRASNEPAGGRGGDTARRPGHGRKPSGPVNSGPVRMAKNHCTNRSIGRSMAVNGMLARASGKRVKKPRN